MVKVYGIYGRTAAIVRIPIGHGNKGFLECEFSRGRLGLGSADRPATYSTGDDIKQSIIENSSLFGHTIKIVRTYQDAESKKTKTIKASSKASNSLGEVADINSREEALLYLKAHGAKAIDLKDDDSIKNFMERIGVDFPNCKF